MGQKEPGEGAQLPLGDISRVRGHRGCQGTVGLGRGCPSPLGPGRERHGGLCSDRWALPAHRDLAPSLEGVMGVIAATPAASLVAVGTLYLEPEVTRPTVQPPLGAPSEARLPGSLPGAAPTFSPHRGQKGRAFES